MKIALALIFTYTTLLSTQAQDTTTPNLQDKKSLLIAHPSQSTIEVLYALWHENLLETDNIHFIGIYHHEEKYDYSQSKAMLDTMQYLSMELLEIKDTLHCDSLFCINQCSAIFEELFNKSEGAVFFGGPDIPPAIYGEDQHPKTIVSDPYRHYFEASFIYHLLGGYQNNNYEPLLENNPDYFMLGICLGMQTMNVATGGTLIQDIPLEVYSSDEAKGLQHLNNDEIHRNYYPKIKRYKNAKLAGSHFHSVVFKDYFFPSFFGINPGLSPLVNSYHHQAVENIGKGFKPGAVSKDEKIIEAIFHAHYPHVFGVQFHPERSQFFLRNKHYQFEPNGKKILLSDGLDDESMQFHLRFWQAINTLLQEL